MLVVEQAAVHGLRPYPATWGTTVFAARRRRGDQAVGLPTSLTEIVGAFRMSESTARSDPTPPRPARRGPGRPRALPVEEQRRQVLDAARTVFAQHGFHGATIEAVARLSGTPRPTVYELFGTKDDLFVVVVDDAAERVVSRLSESFGESEEFSLEAFVRHNFAAVFDLFEQDRDAVMVLLNAEQGVVDRPTSAPADMRTQVLQQVSEFTRSRWGVLGLDVGASAEIMALIFFRMAESLAVRRISDPGWDREAFIDLLTQFTIGGINRLWEHHQDVLIAAGQRTDAATHDPDTDDPDDADDTADDRRHRRHRRQARLRRPGRARRHAVSVDVPVAVVVGGGGAPTVTRAGLGDLGPDPLVVAADEGLEHAVALGLDVGAVVGDMDSVAPAALVAAEASGTDVDRHPVAKDETDLDLAIDRALAARPGRLVVVTGTGDRLDHALAVALSASAPGRPAVPTEAWIGPAHLWVVRAGAEVRLPGRPGDLVSLLPLHGPAGGVTTSGLLYPLADEDLPAGSSRGVSNEWVEAAATVRLRDGVLVAVAPGLPGPGA